MSLFISAPARSSAAPKALANVSTTMSAGVPSMSMRCSIYAMSASISLSLVRISGRSLPNKGASSRLCLFFDRPASESAIYHRRPRHK